MILIVSFRQDLHTITVMKELQQRGLKARLLDLSEFPQNLSLAVNYQPGRPGEYSILGDPQGELRLADCRVTWWRRPQNYRLHAEVNRPAMQSFALNESIEAFNGMWLSLNTFWINQPLREQAAARKVFQLQAAHEVGLETPATLVTNNPAKAQEFIARYGAEHTVYKAFSATEQDWRETRVLTPGELALIENVRYAPVIFQEYIPAQVDLRITVVGERIFAAAIHSQDTSYKTDYRMDMNSTRVEKHELPAPVAEQVLQYMRHLGLVYGAIDMRLRPDGSYVFLEINPTGQWLFIEQRTGQPVTAALVDLMAANDRQTTGFNGLG